MRTELNLRGAEPPADVFARSLAYRPPVGGFLLGAADATPGLVCEAAELAGGATLRLRVRDGGRVAECEYHAPAEELWAAFRVASPDGWMTALTDVGGGECHLADGASGEFPNPDRYSCHPALAASPLGNGFIEAERESLVYFLRRHKDHRPTVVQWYDAPAARRVDGGQLVAAPAAGPADSLLRIRGYRVAEPDVSTADGLAAVARTPGPRPTRRAAGVVPGRGAE